MYEYSYVFKFSRFLNQHRSFLHKPSHLILIHSISFPAIDFVSYYFQEHFVDSETDILRRVCHPNIVQLIEEYESVKEIFLILELVKVSFYSSLEFRHFCHFS